jgi:putative transposase
LFSHREERLAVTWQFGGKERNFSGEHIWAWGLSVSTVGFELAHVYQYIHTKDEADESRSQL